MAVWDVLVVGGRIAGSTLAAYLGRAGLRVLVVERARFPSDLPQQGSWGTEINRRWVDLGVLPAIEATGAPRMFGYDLSTLGVRVGYDYPPLELGFRMSVRRASLDDVLARFAASFPTVEVRQGAEVTGLLWEGERVVGAWLSQDGRGYEERATLVVGADGRYSRVARWVEAETYEEIVSPWASYIADYEGTDCPPDRSVMAWTANTHMVAGRTGPDRVTTAMGVRLTDLEAFRAGLPDSYERWLREDPHMRRAIGPGRRVTKVGGAIGIRMSKRVPVGPGWALVGDAGYHLDPMGARGATAAVAGAGLLADGIVAAIGRDAPLEQSLAGYRHERDALLEPQWRATLATYEIVPPTERDVARARLLAERPDLRELEVRVAWDMAPKEEFERAVEAALAAS